MNRLILSLSTLLFSEVVFAQNSADDGGSLFKFINHINQGITNAVNNGLIDSGIDVFISVSLISFGIFYLIRSLLEYNYGKISFTDLVINKLLFIILIFSLTDITMYTYIFGVIETTANDLGGAVQFMFTGFPDFYKLPGGLLFYFLNINPLTPSFDLLNMVFVALIVFIAALLLWKKVLDAGIAVTFFYFFAFIGFKIVYIFGMLIIPMIFVMEFKFIVVGYFKAVAYMFFFSVVWQMMLGICAFLMFTALFGANFLSYIKNGASMHDFYLIMNDSIASGRGIPIAITTPLDVVIPLFLLSVALILLSKTFEVTQFILTGFMSAKSGFASGQ